MCCALCSLFVCRMLAAVVIVVCFENAFFLQFCGIVEPTPCVFLGIGYDDCTWLAGCLYNIRLFIGRTMIMNLLIYQTSFSSKKQRGHLTRIHLTTLFDTGKYKNGRIRFCNFCLPFRAQKLRGSLINQIGLTSQLLRAKQYL